VSYPIRMITAIRIWDGFKWLEYSRAPNWNGGAASWSPPKPLWMCGTGNVMRVAVSAWNYDLPSASLTLAVYLDGSEKAKVTRTVGSRSDINVSTSDFNVPNRHITVKITLAVSGSVVETIEIPMFNGNLLPTVENPNPEPKPDPQIPPDPHNPDILDPDPEPDGNEGGGGGDNQGGGNGQDPNGQTTSNNGFLTSSNLLLVGLVVVVVLFGVFIVFRRRGVLVE